jgi:hypothetical protein
MSVSSWLLWYFSRSDALRDQRRNLGSRRKKASRLLEHLEGRALLASFTAPTVSALIADINAANTAGGANTITLTAPTTSPYLFTTANNANSGENFLPVITANDKLTVAGNGDTLEPAPRHAGARFFDVTAGASLTLQNLTLAGGSLVDSLLPQSGGGAVYNQGALTLSGATLLENMMKPLDPAAQDGPAMGGGIWSSGSLILENGTIVQKNDIVASYTNPKGYDAFGGGVYIAGGSANISNTTFTGNMAEGGPGDGAISSNGSGLGGALYVAAGNVVMTSSTVNDNEVHGYFDSGDACYGGGVYVAGGTVTLSKDTVQSNSVNDSSGFGGGLYVAGGAVTLNNDLVESNSLNGTISNYGGGLYVAGGTVTLSNDTVESNSASSAGGGIYIAPLATVSIDPFTRAHVINNTASTDPNIDGTYILT